MKLLAEEMPDQEEALAIERNSKEVSSENDLRTRMTMIDTELTDPRAMRS